MFLKTILSSPTYFISHSKIPGCLQKLRQAAGSSNYRECILINWILVASSEAWLCSSSHFPLGSNWQRRLRLQGAQIPLRYVSVGTTAGLCKDFACRPLFQRLLVPNPKPAPPGQSSRTSKQVSFTGRLVVVSVGYLCSALGVIVCLFDRYSPVEPRIATTPNPTSRAR